MKNIISQKFLISSLIIIVLSFIFLRVFAIISTPLELSADEAQYWLWSKELNWGYFSKPPMIAWLIHVSNNIFGDYDYSIRIFAPLIHGINALVIFRLSQEINDNNLAHFLSSLIWLTLPIVGVGSFLMSTDTPLVLIWTTSLLVIVKAYNSDNLFLWNLAGLIAGLALYAKYAALYLPLGLIIFYIINFQYEKNIKLRGLFLFVLNFIIVSLPNVIWNYFNNFHTINHLSSNAVIDAPSYSLIGSLTFLIAQVAILGPLLFIVFLLTAYNIKRLNKLSIFLLYFIFPVYILMFIQGFFSEANENWAASALPAITILCGYFLSKRIKFAVLTIFSNFFICIFILIVSFNGNLIFLDLKSDPLRKLKGWYILSEDLKDTISKKKSDVVLVDRRGIAAELIYYLRNENIKIRVPESSKSPSNHYQLHYSLTDKENKIFYYASENTEIPESYKVGYNAIKVGVSDVQISKKKNRKINIYLIEK